MSRELGRAPTPAEIAERTGATLEQVLEAREASAAYRAVSLDRPRTEDDEEGDPYADAFGIEDPGFGLAEDSATVERLMRVLSEREREVLRLRFEEDLTQSEIGQRVGVSQMHVSRLIRQSISRLRDEADDAAERLARERGRFPGHGALGPAHARRAAASTADPALVARRVAHDRASTCPPASACRTTRCTSARTSSWSTARSRSTPTAAACAAARASRRCSIPHERHEVRATSDARLLLVLAPWPGEGHPGARDASRGRGAAWMPPQRLAPLAARSMPCRRSSDRRRSTRACAAARSGR